MRFCSLHLETYMNVSEILHDSDVTYGQPSQLQRLMRSLTDLVTNEENIKLYWILLFRTHVGKLSFSVLFKNDMLVGGIPNTNNHKLD